MTNTSSQQWFQARLKWAVMEDGPGLTGWREAEYIFLSESSEMALEKALRLGYSEECSMANPGEDWPSQHICFAEIVYLEERGPEPTAFTVNLEEKKAVEQINSGHVFEPEARFREPVF